MAINLASLTDKPYNLLNGTEQIIINDNGTPKDTTVGDIIEKVKLDLSADSSLNLNINFIQTGASAIQTTLTAREDKYFKSVDFGILCDGVTDDSNKLIEAIADISAAGGGTLEINGPIAIYINKSVWIRSNVVLDFRVPVYYGSTGRMGCFGSTDESVTKYLLSQNALAGTSVLKVSPATFVNFNVGDVIILRGENDAYGIAVDREIHRIVSTDPIAYTLSLAAPLENNFLTSYPTSAYPDDKSTIAKVTSSPLQRSHAAGEVLIYIPISDISKFAVGDYIQIQDDYQTRTGNPIHLETNIIVGITTSGPDCILQLAYALGHDYKNSPIATDYGYSSITTPSQAIVIKLKPVTNAGAKNLIVKYKAHSISESYHAFQFAYAANCFVKNIKVLFDPATGFGSRSHTVRFSNGSIQNTADGVMLQRPTYYAAGQGYGVTFYSGARANHAYNILANGARHSVLFFRGATGNVAENIISTDCRGADIDFHGAEETYNTVRNVVIIGGESRSPDINIRSGIKIGNPSHEEFVKHNLVENVHFVNYPHWALYIVSRSYHNTIKNLTGTSRLGIKMQCEAESTAEGTNNIIEDIEVINFNVSGINNDIYPSIAYDIYTINIQGVSDPGAAVLAWGIQNSPNFERHFGGCFEVNGVMKCGYGGYYPGTEIKEWINTFTVTPIVKMPPYITDVYESYITIGDVAGGSNIWNIKLSGISTRPSLNSEHIKLVNCSDVSINDLFMDTYDDDGDPTDNDPNNGDPTFYAIRMDNSSNVRIINPVFENVMNGVKITNNSSKILIDRPKFVSYNLTGLLLDYDSTTTELSFLNYIDVMGSGRYGTFKCATDDTNYKKSAKISNAINITCDRHYLWNTGRENVYYLPSNYTTTITGADKVLPLTGDFAALETTIRNASNLTTLFTISYKPKSPLSTLRLTFNIPYVSISPATGQAIAFAMYSGADSQSKLIGMSVARLTNGEQAGSSMVLVCQSPLEEVPNNNLDSCVIELGLAIAVDTSVLAIDRLQRPYVLIDEIY